jgi:hypothetical protein
MMPMAERYYFAGGWSRALKQVTQSWDADQARRAHEAGKLYTVLVGDAERPTAFIEVNGKFVGVGFLDRLQREYLSYGFSGVEPGKLFLKQATHREFAGDTDKVSNGTTYIFKPEGQVTIRRQQFDPPKLEVAESSTDVAGNYETYPPFGSYDHLLRKERLALA